MELRSEFRQELLVTCFYHERVIDSVHHEELWNIWGIHEIPVRIIDSMTDVKSGIQSTSVCWGGVSDLSLVNSGVMQGCVLAPELFNTSMNWVLSKIADQTRCGPSPGEIKVFDLELVTYTIFLAKSL